MNERARPAMRSMRTVLILRAVTAALVATLAVVAFVSGRLVVGLVLTALVATNVTILTIRLRRRRELLARFGGAPPMAGPSA
jgi:hypothetical protein